MAKPANSTKPTTTAPTPAAKPPTTKPLANLPKAAPASGLKVSASNIAFDPAGVIRSAKGVAQYAYLKKPDQYPGKEPMHKITVYFNGEDAEYLAMVERMLAFENQWRADCGLPATDLPSSIKIEEDSTSPFVGRPKMTASVLAKDAGGGQYVAVPVVDRAAQPTDKAVWSGDVVRISFALGGYNAKQKAIGCGAKAYLRGVQLILAGDRAQSGGTSVFTAEEGVDECSANETSGPDADQTSDLPEESGEASPEDLA